MTIWRWIWTVWILFGIIYEFIWIFTKQYQNTLSDFIWYVAKVRRGQPIEGWTALHFFIFCFLLWLLYHISFEAWR